MDRGDRLLRPCGVLTLLAVLVAAPSALGQEAKPTVSLQSERLSVSASDASLKAILIEIGRLGGIRISVEAALQSQVAQQTVTVSFDDLPLQEGLDRLLRDKSYVLVYASGHLAEIGVYTKGTADLRPLTARAPRRSAKPKTRPPGPRPRPVIEVDPAQLARAETAALEEPEPFDRIVALDTLAISGNEPLGLRIALEVLARERDAEVLEAAMDLLLVLKGPVPVDPLFKLVTHPAPALRRRALILLDEHGGSDSRVGNVLTRLAREDSDPSVLQTAQSLLKFRGPK